MEQMEDLPAHLLGPPVVTGGIAAPDIEMIGMVRSAILSGGVVLAMSLIAVASAATLHIGPFTHKENTPARGVSIHLDGSSAPASESGAPEVPVYPSMLIAQDPGDEAWQRMLAVASDAPHNLPISVTAIGAVKPIGALPALAYRTMDVSPVWAKLSAIQSIGAWGPFILTPGSPQSSLFTKTTEPHETPESAIISAPVTSTPTSPAPDSTPAPALTLTATPDPSPPTPPTPSPAVTAPSVPPVIFQAPPPPPANTGSSQPSGSLTPPVSPVPEPASWMSFIIGFGLIGFLRRRAIVQDRRRTA
jgi:hypothetical protein